MQVVNAQDILDTARNVYLNDQLGRFTNAILLPHLKEAIGFMETSLEENGVSCKSDIEAEIPVPAGLTELPLPSDFVWPITLRERPLGSTDRYSEMYQKIWEPDITPGDRLVYWSWRLDKILLLGATTDREVKLYYVRSFPIVNVATDVVYAYGKQYLSAKTAAMAHMLIAQNETLAGLCNETAEANIGQIINIQTKKGQANPIRRRPYAPFR